ncbi:MAG: hypothetical protein HQK65_19900 [Desulfamplus sp.]|nr:hypothetical protein [Desulfamplus sp.]
MSETGGKPKESREGEQRFEAGDGRLRLKSGNKGAHCGNEIECVDIEGPYRHFCSQGELILTCFSFESKYLLAILDKLQKKM